MSRGFSFFVLFLGICSTLGGGCSHGRGARPPLRSPFPSTVPEISIPNTHLVEARKGRILRGMAPHTSTEITELADFGVDQILIFRNDTKNESTAAEELKLIAGEPRIHAVHMIPFPWKDIVDFRKACRQTVRALEILKASASSSGGALFFHCTVGEDRTGYLAGLYRVLFDRMSPREAFQTEMCARGFAEADPTKPEHVSEKVRANLTPLFLKMVILIESQRLTKESLDTGACEFEPALGAKHSPQAFKCSPFQ